MKEFLSLSKNQKCEVLCLVERRNECGEIVNNSTLLRITSHNRGDGSIYMYIHTLVFFLAGMGVMP